jgi:hypothetical protein
MKGTEYEELLDFYGLLVLTVGENCTKEHIHDAWSIWRNRTQPKHYSIKPFNKLTKEAQNLDEPYRLAVIQTARMLKEIQKGDEIHTNNRQTKPLINNN